MNYYIWLIAYICASVASQFLTTTPLELGVIAGVVIWLPLSAVTLVPLVDVLRCFTQYRAEKDGRAFKTVVRQMLGLSMVSSGLCVAFAGLPIQIFTGVLIAVTVGGVVDFFSFRAMAMITDHPVKRMVVSNLLTTLIGSGIVFFVAFTDWFFPASSFTKPLFEVVVGWLAQSFVIWLSGLVIASLIQKVRTRNASA